MTILVTGAHGFIARRMIPLLSAESSTPIHCVDKHICSDDEVTVCDLAEYADVGELLARVRPSQIYHLAGTFTNSYETDYRSNVLSSRNILEAMVALRSTARVLLVGSCAEYGFVCRSENPVSEEHSLRPISIYGVTKAFQSCLMGYYVAAHQLDIVMARPFNLVGKGASTDLFVGKVESQIEAVKRGEAHVVEVGFLGHRRDYLDVDSAVRYLRDIMQKGQRGETYNVGSGKSVLMRGFLEEIMSDNNLSMGIVREGQETGAPSTEIVDIYADVRKLKNLVES